MKYGRHYSRKWLYDIPDETNFIQTEIGEIDINDINEFSDLFGCINIHDGFHTVNIDVTTKIGKDAPDYTHPINETLKAIDTIISEITIFRNKLKETHRQATNKLIRSNCGTD